ncbi:MAG: ribonuclease P protein component [Selenomonadaceae bacterium]|nr:ribonuclease P protein component [Selenomonadaceae bacterium]MBP3721930.1 ribonuclease P protein component [Selenomonadaceae bacterium]
MKDTIKNKEQFQKIYSEGKKFADNNILICVMSGSGKTAFVAGKKLGCAPVRNRLKRLLREAYRLNSDDIRDDVDIIFVARAGLIGKKLDAAAASFNKLKKRAGIVR